MDSFNADDDLIGYGSVVAKITAGQLTQSEVSITPLEGTGSLDVIISWPESTVASPVMTGTLTAEAGAPESISFSPSGNSASYSASDLEVGYYMLILQLYDGEDLVWSYMEAVRILKDQLTEAVYSLTF